MRNVTGFCKRPQPVFPRWLCKSKIRYSWLHSSPPPLTKMTWEPRKKATCNRYCSLMSVTLTAMNYFLESDSALGLTPPARYQPSSHSPVFISLWGEGARGHLAVPIPLLPHSKAALSRLCPVTKLSPFPLTGTWTPRVQIQEDFCHIIMEKEEKIMTATVES